MDYYKKGSEPYTLGRGKIYIAAADDWADPGDHTKGRLWQDLFHIKEFKITPTATKVEHKNYNGPIVRTDRVAIGEQSANFSFVVDVPCVENINLMLLGSGATEIAQASGSLTAVSLTVAEVGKWHEILDSTDNNLYNLSGFSITDDSTPTPVPLTEGEDYDVDLVHGRIVFYPDGPLLIKATDIVKITATIPADTIHEIEGGSNPRLQRHIWFCGNPSEGIIHQVRGWGLLVPSGDFPMIGDDWEGFTMEGSFMAHVDYGLLGFKMRQVGTVVAV